MLINAPKRHQHLRHLDPKRTLTSAAPAMSQAAIRKLVADSVAAALEALAATMANTNNTNRNTRQSGTPVARKYSYKEFMSCQPFNFKVKLATSTLIEEPLSWSNLFAQPIEIEEAYKITWSKFKQLLIKSPRTEILCPTMVPNSQKLMEVFIWGLPRGIEGNVTTSKPQTLEKAITITQRLMDQVTKHNSMQGTNDHKSKFDDRRTFTNNNNYQNNHNNNSNCNNDHQQQQNRRQETVRAYAVTPTENSRYTESLPLCKKCTLHHTGPCTIKCQTCNKVGHQTRNCRNKGTATGSNLQPVFITCHACGEKGHYKIQCSIANNNSKGRAYLLRDKNAHQDPNIVTGTFLLNQHLAKVLFDSGADKSFVSISLASMINIPSITLDTTYDIEMADGNLVGTNTVIQGCTLILLNQPFKINLMLIKLGSFDIVIGMDWLSKYHARIICDEKVVHIPINGETLIIREFSYFSPSIGDSSQTKNTTKDIPVVREFLEVFPKDLPGLPRFIEGFSKIAKPLTELTQKNKKYIWGENQESAFQLLKQKLYEAPILALLEGNDDFFVYCDASHQGLGAVLRQREKFIAYASRQLKPHEENYTIHDLELGTVVFALKIWRHCLYGTKCFVFTDHKSLQHILDQKDFNMRQRRWLEFLADYDSQSEAIKEENIKAENLRGMDKAFEVRPNGTRCIKNRNWLPLFGNLRDLIMHESYKSKYSVYPGSDKMYQDLKKLYWWPNMKAIIAEYVNCDSHFTSRFWQSMQSALGTQLDMSTAYHLKTDGQSERTIQTLEDMLRACVIDFGKGWERHLPLVEFSYNNIYHVSIKAAPFEALYGRKCRSPVCWAEQRSYANIRQKPLEFQVRDCVMLKVSPQKGVIRFGMQGKLNPQYIRPFKILDRIGPVAYKLELPEELSNVHNTFYVSNLKKCQSDESFIIPMKELRLDGKLNFMEETNRIYRLRSQATKRKSHPYSQSKMEL
ncbi:putative reverse transcriptase domain-containing protein [Tanacetum coccineum]